jgi:hypothetical protein
MFGWSRKKSYSEEAKRLLQLSQIVPVTSTTTILDAFPAIENLFRRPEFSIEQHWDFFVTSACLGTGLFLYGRDHPNDVRLFATALLPEVAKWNEQAISAIDDFQKFVNRNTESGVDLATSVGSWVIWNLKGNTPAKNEFGPARAIGTLIVNGLHDWHKS